MGNALVKVRFYGRLAEALGDELEIDEAPGCSVGQLRERLISQHPHAAQPLRSERSRACVGDVLVQDDYVVSAYEKVEFLPPVSGG